MADAGSARHNASAAAEIRVVTGKPADIDFSPGAAWYSAAVYGVALGEIFPEQLPGVVICADDFLGCNCVAGLQNATFG
jgi:hypothetical protein